MAGSRNVEEAILDRFSQLVSEGETLVSRRFQSDSNTASGLDRAASVAWLYSAINLLELATPLNSPFRSEATELRPKPTDTIFGTRVAAVLGLLKSAYAESSTGLLRSLETHFVGLAFEDFLSHASVSLEEGRITEAAVLASAVFEDTIKRLCRANNIPVENQTLDPLINALVHSKVIGNVKAQRFRAYAAVRNRAAHAEWNVIDNQSLKQMIEGVEELLETYFE